MLQSEDGRTLYRRDPYARQTDYVSNWCYAVDPSAYEWKNTDWQQLEHDRYIIYEMQVGAMLALLLALLALLLLLLASASGSWCRQ
jgi:1,4-alpha-glucan branching enzyme